MTSTVAAPSSSSIRGPEVEAGASSSRPRPHGVRLDAVARSFASRQGRHDVLREVDITLGSGEIVAVVGPSGCGKSTLLRLIAGLDQPTGGVIRIGPAAISGTDERTAVAFQEPRLLPWRTLEQNVALGLPRGTGRREGRERVRHLLQLVGLEHAAGQRPREVSGGMAQRTSLARALARNPEVLLLDEPFGALDALTRLRMQDLLLEIHAAEPTTVLVVTHDVEEALYLADRVLLLRSLREADAQHAGAQHAAGRTPAGPTPAGSTLAGSTPAGPTAGADLLGSVARIVEVPGSRPRDRTDHTLADLRGELLEGLGVHSHHGPAPAARATLTAPESRTTPTISEDPS